MSLFVNNYLYGNSNGVYGIGTYMSDNISIINNTFNIFGGNLSKLLKFMIYWVLDKGLLD